MMLNEYLDKFEEYNTEKEKIYYRISFLFKILINYSNIVKKVKPLERDENLNKELLHFLKELYTSDKCDKIIIQNRGRHRRKYSLGSKSDSSSDEEMGHVNDLEEEIQKLTIDNRYKDFSKRQFTNYFNQCGLKSENKFYSLKTETLLQKKEFLIDLKKRINIKIKECEFEFKQKIKPGKLVLTNIHNKHSKNINSINFQTPRYNVKLPPLLSPLKHRNETLESQSERKSTTK